MCSLCMCVCAHTHTHSLTHSHICTKLFMVDLAGSETVKKTGAEGQTLKEAQVCTHVYIYTHYYYLTYIAHSALTLRTCLLCLPYN